MNGGKQKIICRSNHTILILLIMRPSPKFSNGFIQYLKKVIIFIDFITRYELYSI